MTSLEWIISLAVFMSLFWLVARRSLRGRHRDQTQHENAELRHVVAEMAMERHRRRTP